ncbi:MAG TPA: transposase [Agriterribacter sp.]|nr:transposase [Agriterribacter sp.]
MSSKFKSGDDALPHFVTFTVIGWIDVFSREMYKEIFVDSLRYCTEQKGLKLHAWVIMTNHCHLIISTENNRIMDLVRDIKKYTSKKIIQAIEENEQESRKEWMLNLFSFAGRSNTNNKDFQFWKQDYHPIELNTPELLDQRMKYLHENPVRSGLVWEPWFFKHSSATDYYTNEKGLIKIERLL